MTNRAGGSRSHGAPGPELGPADPSDSIRAIGARLSTAVRFLRPARAEPTSEALPGALSDVGRYHELLGARGDAPALSERVCDDLDLDLVFRRVDRCDSTTGQQVLYSVLHRPLERPEAIDARDALVGVLTAEADLRERISSALTGLRSRGAYSLPVLFLGAVSDRPSWWPLVPLLGSAAVAAIGCSFVTPFAWLALAAIILVNMFVHKYFRPMLERFVAPMTALPALMKAAQQLASLEHPALHAHAAALQTAHQRLGHLDLYARRFVQELNSNEVVATAVGYANLLFLLDLNAFVFGIARVQRHREDLHTLFESIGFLDASSSVARFRESLPAWCAPTFVPAGKRIDGRGLYHPLLTSPVANDLCLDGQDLVVTGSNMAGKTTYLRAAGVAAVLAQSIATVPGAVGCVGSRAPLPRPRRQHLSCCDARRRAGAPSRRGLGILALSRIGGRGRRRLRLPRSPRCVICPKRSTDAGGIGYPRDLVEDAFATYAQLGSSANEP